ncbi:MAG TPA: hypothetical protein VM533_11565 [Fimbriiglobus sp.]|jgi:hypothetical protein|nr:hypothetical protein [Fimbriiglobus sp.]
MSTDGGLGGGGFFGRVGGGNEQWGPKGPYGCWPSCGCGAIIMILGVILLVCGGALSMLEGMLR